LPKQLLLLPLLLKLTVRLFEPWPRQSQQTLILSYTYGEFDPATAGCYSHQRNPAIAHHRQNPQSPQNIIRTPPTLGQACGSLSTNNFKTAQACRAASLLPSPPAPARPAAIAACKPSGNRRIAMHKLIARVKIQNQLSPWLAHAGKTAR